MEKVGIDFKELGFPRFTQVGIVAENYTAQIEQNWPEDTDIKLYIQ